MAGWTKLPRDRTPESVISSTAEASVERVRWPVTSPAVAIAAAFAFGIGLDRWLNVSWSLWLLSAAALALLWLTAFTIRFFRVSAICLVLCCVCLGGVRHHRFWSVARSDHVTTYLTDDDQLVRLIGVAAETPWIRPVREPAWNGGPLRPDRSVCTIDCRAIATEKGRLPVSGRVRLTVDGHLLHVAAGDEVEVTGRLVRPRRPGNPGEFDYAAYLRSHRCHALLHSNHPGAVRVVSRERQSRLWAVVHHLRQQCQDLMLRHLDGSRLEVASALLLGDRSGLTDEVRKRFVNSGSMHVLAISGLHVGILAGFVWIGCRWLNLSNFSRLLVLLTILIVYTMMTGGRPPVVRAVLLILIAATGFCWNRRWSLQNALAFAALVVLAWNPSYLFDVGTQLSFLAVMGIIAAERWLGSGPVRRWFEPAAGLPDENVLRRGARWMAGRIGQGYAVVAFIWLFTLPLAAARFHVISPVGLLINVVLVPMVCVVLGTGYAFLFCGLLLPGTAHYLGSIFDTGLAALLGLVHRSAELHLAHLYVPGPPAWWLWGYYALLLASMHRLPVVAGLRTSWRLLLVWLVAGLGVGAVPRHSDGLRLTFLEMGHGLSVVVQAPSGKTLLYDAGSLMDPDRAQRTVQEALWEEGIGRVDVAMVSHADADHLNALPGLMRTMPVGTLLVGPTLLDSQQPPVKELHRAAAGSAVPLRTVEAGDRLLLDEDVAFRILQPSGDESLGDDNANSLVVSIEYAGRRLLLTGDLNPDGLRHLLAGPRLDCDVLLAPHHGAAASNPRALAIWAQPRWVVVSTPDVERLELLREVYGPGCRVLATGEVGAVTVTVSPTGTVEVDGYRE